MKIDGLAKAVNRKFSPKNTDIAVHNRSGEQKRNMDNVSFSQSARLAFGKKDTGNGMMDSLLKQKETIIKNKNDLIARTQEDGGDISAIQDQLKNYEEQLKEIDTQISQAAAEEQRGSLNEEGKTEGSKKTNTMVSSSPQTEQEQQSVDMNNLLALSGRIKQSDTLQSSKINMENQLRVLKSEAQLDSSPVSSRISQISEMEQKVSSLNDAVLNMSADISRAAIEQTRTDTSVKQADNTAETNSTEEASTGKTERELKISQYTKLQTQLNQDVKQFMIEKKA